VFIIFKLTVLLIIFFSLCLQNLAVADSRSMAISFSIKPGLCVLGQQETECRDQLRVQWQAARVYSLCLHQENNPSAIYCWQPAKAGKYQFDFVASETTEFHLRDVNTRAILSTKAFKILTDHRSAAHGRRNPWSFF